MTSDHPAAILLVAATCWAVTFLGWWVLSLPSRLVEASVGRALASILPTDCRLKAPGTLEMEVCTVGVAFQTLTTAALVMLVMFLFRRQLSAGLQKGFKALPRPIAYLGPPLTAAVVFALGWAALHLHTPWIWGLLPHIWFPPVVGAFTFATVQWGPRLHRTLATVFAWRDKAPFKLRLLVTLGIPIVVSVLLTRALSANATQDVTWPAGIEQVVVLLGLAVGWALLAPSQAAEGRGEDAGQGASA